MHLPRLLALVGLVGLGRGWSGFAKRQDDASTDVSSSTTTASLSFPVTVGSGTNRMTIIATTLMSAPTSPTATFNAANILAAPPLPQETNAPEALGAPPAKRQLWGKEQCQADCYQQWKAIFCQDGPACDAGYDKCMKKCDKCQDFCQDEATCCPKKSLVKDGVEEWVWARTFGKDLSQREAEPISFRDYQTHYHGLEFPGLAKRQGAQTKQQLECFQNCDYQFYICHIGGFDVNYCLKTYGNTCSACYKACGQQPCAKEERSLEKRQITQTQLICTQQCDAQFHVCMASILDVNYYLKTYGNTCSACYKACGQQHCVRELEQLQSPAEKRDFPAIDSPLASTAKSAKAVTKRQTDNDCVVACDNTYKQCLADGKSNTCAADVQQCLGNCMASKDLAERTPTATTPNPASPVQLVAKRQETVPCTASAWDLCNCNCTDQWNVCLAGGHGHTYCDPVCVECYYMCLQQPGGGKSKLMIRDTLDQSSSVPQTEALAETDVQPSNAKRQQDKWEACIYDCGEAWTTCLQSTSHTKEDCGNMYLFCARGCDEYAHTIPPPEATKRAIADVNVKRQSSGSEREKCTGDCGQAYFTCLQGGHDPAECLSEYNFCVIGCPQDPGAPSSDLSSKRTIQQSDNKRQLTAWQQCTVKCVEDYNVCVKTKPDETICRKNYDQCIMMCSGIPHPPVKRTEEESCINHCNWAEDQCISSPSADGAYCDGEATACYHKCKAGAVAKRSDISRAYASPKAIRLQQRQQGNIGEHCACCCLKLHNRCRNEGGTDCDDQYYSCDSSCLAHPDWWCTHPGVTIDGSACPADSDDLNCLPPDKTCTGNE